MAWEDLAPLKSRKKLGSRKSAVFCGSNGDGSRFQHWLSVSLHSDLFDLAWLKRNALVKVQLSGRQVRIAQGGTHRLFGLGSRSGTDLVAVRVPPLPGQSKLPFRQEPCEFSIQEGAVIVTLPDWCFAKAEPRPVAMPLVVVPAAAGGGKRAGGGAGGRGAVQAGGAEPCGCAETARRAWG